jgi:riboflavin synthase
LGLTTLGHKRVGDLVNLEVDVIAKYVERLLTHSTTNTESTV